MASVLSSQKVQEGKSHIWPEVDVDPECAAMSDLIVPVPGALARTTLACFPGSGSKWYLSLIQFMSGYMTQDSLGTSVWLPKSHHDSDHTIVEVLSTGRPRPPSPARQRMAAVFKAEGRSILLLRNPFNAIVSWWNHVQSGSVYYGPGLTDALLEETLGTEEFCRFARAEAENWELQALDVLALSVDVLVVHYEDLREDFERQLTRTLRFLRVPIEERKLDCLRRYSVVVHKRRARERQGRFFCREARDRVGRAVREVRAALRELHLARIHPSYLDDLQDAEEQSLR